MAVPFAETAIRSPSRREPGDAPALARGLAQGESDASASAHIHPVSEHLSSFAATIAYAATVISMQRAGEIRDVILSLDVLSDLSTLERVPTA